MPDLIFNFGLLAIAGFLAGLIDAVVGGGGLIQIPALFSMLPNTVPATVLGTNKLAGIFGTTVARSRCRICICFSGCLYGHSYTDGCDP